MLSPDENVLFAELQKLQGKISGDLARFGKFPLPMIFRFLPVWLLAVLLLGVRGGGSGAGPFRKEYDFPF